MRKTTIVWRLMSGFQEGSVLMLLARTAVLLREGTVPDSYSKARLCVCHGQVGAPFPEHLLWAERCARLHRRAVPGTAGQAGFPH